jgi:hypothetical protein
MWSLTMVGPSIITLAELNPGEVSGGFFKNNSSRKIVFETAPKHPGFEV